MMGRMLAVALCLAVAPLPRLTAQWSVTVEATASYFGGASRDAGADPTAIRPHHPISLGLRVDRRFGRLGVGVAAARAAPDMIAENHGGGIVAKGALDWYEVAPEAAMLLGKAESGAAVRVHAGPLIDIWSPDGADTRARVGGHAGVSLEWPLSVRFAGSIRAAAAVTGSLFDPGELPSGFERRVMWRRSMSLGVRYRL